MELNQLNYLLNTLVNYQRNLQQKIVRLDRTNNNVELTRDSKFLQGFFDQPKAIDSQKYYAFKSKLIARGASQQSASSIAVLLVNIQKKTGITADVILEQAEKLGIQFTDSVFEEINRNRTPVTQLFASKNLLVSESLISNPPEYIPTLIGEICIDINVTGDYTSIEWTVGDLGQGTSLGTLVATGGCDEVEYEWRILGD